MKKVSLFTLCFLICTVLISCNRMTSDHIEDTETGKNNEAQIETQAGTQILDISELSTLEKIKNADPDCIVHNGYVYFSYKEQWCVGKYDISSEKTLHLRAFETKSVTLSDQLSIKDNMKMNIYDVVKVAGLPTRAFTGIRESISLVFESDEGTVATVHLEADGESVREFDVNLFTIDFKGMKYADIKRIMDLDGTQLYPDKNIYYWTGGLRVWLEPSSDPINDWTVSDFVIGNKYADDENAASVGMLEYSFWGISEKKLYECDIVYRIIDAINNAKNIGEKVEKISDRDINESLYDLDIPYGTLWLEIGSEIYRIDSNFEQLSRVDKHLGEGEALEFSAELRKDIIDAWQYYRTPDIPLNWYSGKYTRSTDTLVLDHVHKAYSAVSVTVKSFDVASDFGALSKVVLELVSERDKTLSIGVDSWQSDDVLGAGEAKTLDLKAGVAQTVELTFGGFDRQFWIDISVDNTVCNIVIDPE